MGRPSYIENPIKIDVMRRERGMTIKELAEQADVNRRTIEDWFQRRKPPANAYILEKIAKLFGCKIKDLIEPIEDYENK